MSFYKMCICSVSVRKKAFVNSALRGLTIALVIAPMVVFITEAAVNPVLLTTPLILCAVQLFTRVGCGCGSSEERTRGQVTKRNKSKSCKQLAQFSNCLIYHLDYQLVKFNFTTLQSRAPLRDVQPQNGAGSLIGWDGRAQHAIGWSVEAEIIDTGSEEWLRVRV